MIQTRFWILVSSTRSVINRTHTQMAQFYSLLNADAMHPRIKYHCFTKGLGATHCWNVHRCVGACCFWRSSSSLSQRERTALVWKNAEARKRERAKLKGRRKALIRYKGGKSGSFTPVSSGWVVGPGERRGPHAVIEGIERTPAHSRPVPVAHCYDWIEGFGWKWQAWVSQKSFSWIQKYNSTSGYCVYERKDL